MKTKEMTVVEKHVSKYLMGEPIVLHQVNNDEAHIDCLLYKPNEQYPFWKLVTMGASDYKMPKGHCIADRNEYLMFVDKDENLEDKELLSYYHSQLLQIAQYPIKHKSLVSYGHDLSWNTNEEMCGAYIDLPQVINDIGILKLKLGFMKTVAFLSVVLLNKTDLDLLKKMGNESFSYYLCPEGNGTMHFLSQRTRTDVF